MFILRDVYSGPQYSDSQLRWLEGNVFQPSGERCVYVHKTETT